MRSTKAVEPPFQIFGISQLSIKILLAISLVLFYILALPAVCVMAGIQQAKIKELRVNALDLQQQLSEFGSMLGEQSDRLERLESENKEMQSNFSKEFRDNVYGNLLLIEQEQSAIHDTILSMRKSFDGKQGSIAKTGSESRTCSIN